MSENRDATWAKLFRFMLPDSHQRMVGGEEKMNTVLDKWREGLRMLKNTATGPLVSQESRPNHL